jgi:hypothetical protein
MARYLAVTAVQQQGRKISHPDAGRSDDGRSDPPTVPDGRRLVAVVNNGEWQAAIDVTFPTFYERVHRRFREGVWKELDLYLIDAERVAEIEDGRRVLMNGQPVQDPGKI